MASREELTARYRSTVQMLAGREGLGLAQDLAYRIVMGQIAADASVQQDILDEIYGSEVSARG